MADEPLGEPNGDIPIAKGFVIDDFPVLFLEHELQRLFVGGQLVHEQRLSLENSGQGALL